ncbi:unnamed protein product [marine sediment metagenome]|uniref:Uncharacterized protein n=1 Tax=marine sediment metagenome TaxID=412755 RepID=X0S7X3_9ZZZZ
MRIREVTKEEFNETPDSIAYFVTPNTEIAKENRRLQRLQNR